MKTNFLTAQCTGKVADFTTKAAELLQRKDILLVDTVARQKYDTAESKPEIYSFRGSTDTVDFSKEVLDPQGCNPIFYKQNPTFMLRHDHGVDPIGSVVSLAIGEKSVDVYMHFDESELAQDQKAQYERGNKRAISVGFVTQGAKMLEGTEKTLEVTLHDGRKKTVDLSRYPGALKYTYNWTPIEFSAVNVGMNPDALLADIRSAFGDLITFKSMDQISIETKAFFDEDMKVDFDRIGLLVKEITERYSDYKLKTIVAKHTTPVNSDLPWNAQEAKAKIAMWASPDGSGKKEQINWNFYSKGFAHFDVTKLNNLGAYSFVHHSVDQGVLVCVMKGLTSAMASCFKSSLSEEEKQGVYDHLAGHYQDASVEPPVYGKSYTDEELKQIENGTFGKKVIEEPQELPDPISIPDYAPQFKSIDEKFEETNSAICMVKFLIQIMDEKIDIIQKGKIVEDLKQQPSKKIEPQFEIDMDAILEGCKAINQLPVSQK